MSVKPVELNSGKQEDRLKGNINCTYYHIFHAIINTADVQTDTTIYHQ